jgi:carbonic anhydrase/acetyltransferase-like protein (isoleucine patch superfamily)
MVLTRQQRGLHPLLLERITSMIIKHRGIEPQIDPSVYLAPTATVVGNVSVGPSARVMFGAVINSEGSKIRIGRSAIISENAVIRATAEGNKDHPVDIGENVFIGPHTTILGAMLEPCSYIATGATILQGARISSGSVVTVGALVHANTVIPKDYFVPPHMIAIGDPVQLFSPDQKDELGKAIMSVEFARTAFNIDVSEKARAEIYEETTLVRSKEYEAHFEDQIITEK